MTDEDLIVRLQLLGVEVRPCSWVTNDFNVIDPRGVGVIIWHSKGEPGWYVPALQSEQNDVPLVSADEAYAFICERMGIQP